MSGEVFVDVDWFNRCKAGKPCSGDVFLSERSQDRADVIAVLTDGLGSGQQANVAASLTATMAIEYMKADLDLRRAAEMIMDALPICPERFISYSTFTMIHARAEGTVRLIEYENPPTRLFRGGTPIDLPRECLALPRWNGRKLHCATFRMEKGDRLVFFSDGVTQAGLGTRPHPFGWGIQAVAPAISERLDRIPGQSARELCRSLVNAATRLDGDRAGDDTTACAIHYRDPRLLHILTGPPFSKTRDAAFAALAVQPGAKSAVCGGTTAEIVARELGRTLETPLRGCDPDVPAASEMPGVDLVTEGCITLSKTADLLESAQEPRRANAATRLRDLLLESDRILFAVGTGMNPAHHDPDLPVTLDIRRNIVKRLAQTLEKRYFKNVAINYC